MVITTTLPSVRYIHARYAPPRTPETLHVSSPSASGVREQPTSAPARHAQAGAHVTKPKLSVAPSPCSPLLPIRARVKHMLTQGASTLDPRDTRYALRSLVGTRGGSFRSSPWPMCTLDLSPYYGCGAAQMYHRESHEPDPKCACQCRCGVAIRTAPPLQACINCSK